MINNSIYGNLLAETIPGVIESQKEYHRIEKIFDRLFNKDRSPEEDKLFDLLADLLEGYEKRKFEPVADLTPVEALKHFIDDRGLKQKNLVSIFKAESVVSEIIAGKREISLDYARQLGEFCNVSYKYFL